MDSLVKPEATALGHLMLSTVGSARRLLYAQNLAYAGLTELRITACHALATRDDNLAAAVCMRIDALPKRAEEEIGFTRKGLALALTKKGEPL